jgi:protein TonB
MHPEAFPLSAPHAVESRRLAAFLAVSVALHAAIVFIAPALKWDSVVFEPMALEVRILNPAPAPAAAERPEPQPQAQAEPRREPEKIAPKPSREPAPAAAASRPDPVVEGSFQVAPPTLPGPPPEAKPQPASVPVTPPIYDAVYLSNPAPAYPPAARRAGRQGTVTLRVLVKRDGLPLKVEVEKSSGSSLLDDAARDTVWGWRFAPARQGGDPIESWVHVPVVFRLEGPG